MTIKALLKDLAPPILVRLLGSRSEPVVVEPVLPKVHSVRAGPLRGYRLLVNDHQPAFREMLDGSYDDYIWPATPEQIQSGLVIDIGAHIGYHALAFAARYPNCQVIAFEPSGVNAARLAENLALNPELQSRVDVQQAALSDTNGSVSFNSSANIEDQTSSGGYLSEVVPPLEASIYQRSSFQPSMVNTHRLDDLARSMAWRPIRLIKIDVEGAEHLVLAGALEVLERDRPLLLIEIHSAVCMLRVLQIVSPMGYHVRLLHEDRPGRCFIVAE